MAISSHEYQGLARASKGKKKSSPPTVKAPSISKEAKKHLIPWQSSPQKRTSMTSL
jgi:hypothetical protein